MTTYLYETIPTQPGEPGKLLEIRQGTNDEPLTRHPETGEAIRRVILGGWGAKPTAKAIKLPTSDEGGGCGCGPSGCC